MDIFIRYLAKTDYLPNKFFTRAYDSRILFILSGKGRIYFEGNDYELTENTLCYYPCGEKYMPLSSEEEPLFFVNINFDFSLKYKHILGTLPPLPADRFDESKMHRVTLPEELSIFEKPFVIHDLQMLRADFLKIAEVYYHGISVSDKYYREKSSALFQYALYRILEHNSKTERGLYERIVEYVSENCAAISSNAEIASHFNYHPYYIGQLFKKAGGVSLHKFHLEKKLELAASLLSSTDKSVSEIAAESGFSDSNYFSACFSKKYGCSPSAFRSVNRIYV